MTNPNSSPRSAPHPWNRSKDARETGDTFDIQREPKREVTNMPATARRRGQRKAYTRKANPKPPGPKAKHVEPLTATIQVHIHGDIVAARDAFMEAALRAADRAHDGRPTHMAQALGIHRNTLSAMVKQYLPPGPHVNGHAGPKGRETRG